MHKEARAAAATQQRLTKSPPFTRVSTNAGDKLSTRYTAPHVVVMVSMPNFPLPSPPLPTSSLSLVVLSTFAVHPSQFFTFLSPFPSSFHLSSAIFCSSNFLFRSPASLFFSPLLLLSHLPVVTSSFDRLLFSLFNSFFSNRPCSLLTSICFSFFLPPLPPLPSCPRWFPPTSVLHTCQPPSPPHISFRHHLFLHHLFFRLPFSLFCTAVQFFLHSFSPFFYVPFQVHQEY